MALLKNTNSGHFITAFDVGEEMKRAASNTLAEKFEQYEKEQNDLIKAQSLVIDGVLSDLSEIRFDNKILFESVKELNKQLLLLKILTAILTMTSVYALI